MTLPLPPGFEIRHECVPHQGDGIEIVHAGAAEGAIRWTESRPAR